MTKRFGAITSTRLDNYAGTVAPVSTDDSSAGYDVGSLWFDTVKQNCYICIDATASAAVWKLITVSTVLAGSVIAPEMWRAGASSRSLSTTVANVGLVEIPASISVKTITLREGGSQGVAGATLRFAVYSFDGQTRYINVTSGDAPSNTYFTITLGTAVYLPRGYYYLLTARTDATLRGPTLSFYTTQTGGLEVSPAGSLPVLEGTLTVSSPGVAPSTFDPSTLTKADSEVVICRFDNA